MARTVTVQRTGRTWGIFVDGELVEGGFFSRDRAREASSEYRERRPAPGSWRDYEAAQAGV